ncbi:MAG TPA: BTAD domain-containing putative transcriptional regulator [Nocardioidaceae bacterium]|nr:BTAD domain-containing putative transcriptional regulator [Nocardioidaceae bacterium]
MAVEVRVLGRTRALRDGVEVHLGGRKPAEVLTLLAVEAGRPVSASVLAERLWRGSPPATAGTTLQGHVARLRRVLEPDRSRPVLVTVGDGYALRGVDVDANRAASLVTEGRDAVRSGASGRGAALFAEALRLWSGASLEDVRDVPDVSAEAGRLDELRLTAVEEWASAALAAGAATELVPDLGVHAAAHPLRERVQGLLARALYRSGRQSEALEVLDRLRHRLADELGVDPSSELRELHQAVLRQDPCLDAPAAARGDQSASSDDTGSDGFVGRQAELRDLVQAWQSVLRGRTTAVAVTGEPGIGKTRLVEELASSVGVVPRWGRSPHTAGSPPFWPWQQVLGGLPRVPGDDVGDAARWALGMHVVSRLRDLAGQGPQLVVLDDLQWADADSLHVLDVVMSTLQDAPLLFVVTCRDDPGPHVGAVLARLARTSGARRVSLRGLAPEHVARLVETSTGAALGENEAGALTARTGGNPFFVGELATLGGEALTVVPDGVRDVVRLRLAGLPTGTQPLLEVLAVAARELPVAVAAGALGAAPADLHGPLAAALSARLLLEQTPGRLLLAHDLIRDTLLADLGPTRRAALHAGLADALASGAGWATSAAAIAVHRSEATLGGLDDLAASACLVAAQESLDRAADVEAMDLAQRGRSHAETPDLLADLSHVVGVATRRLGRLEESRAAFDEEAAIARRGGDVARLARAAVAAAGGGIGGYWTTFAAPFTTDVRLLEEAAERSAALDPGQRCAVLAALAVQRSARGEGGGDGLAERALSAAQEDGGPDALRRAQVASFVARWTPATATERVALAEELLRGSSGAATEATALHLLRAALLETGRLTESEAVSRRLATLAAQRGDADVRLLDTWWRVGQLLQRGEHEAARRLAATASGDTPAVSPAAAALASSSIATVEGIAAWHEGRLGDLVPTAVDLAASVEPEWLVIQALGHATAGDHDQARAAVERLRGVPSAGARQPVRTVLLAEVYVELGDVEGCADLLPVLEEYGNTVVVLWPGVVALGPAALYRGSVLAVLGQSERAAADLGRARDLAERMHAAPYARLAASRLRLLSGTAVPGSQDRHEAPWGA